MNIDSNTTQEQLIHLTEAAMKRRLTRALPFNKEGIRGMLLFILFPAMVLGFRVGLLFTAAVAGVMAAFLLFGREGVATVMVQYYLILGGVVSVAIAVMVFLKEKKRIKELRSYAKPDSALGLRVGYATPVHHSMKLKAQNDASYLASFDLSLDNKGVYAFLIELSNYGWATKVVTSKGQEACLFSWGEGQKPSQAICLFRLAAGVHRLQMRISQQKKSADKKMPVVKITQINQRKSS